MNTRTGKIARLPKNIREQINQRLENGERTPTILQWLNDLPEVQKLITEQFGGHPIRQQNLSQWRLGGYIDWTRHQLLREQTRRNSEQALDLAHDTVQESISIAEDIAMIMSAELGLHVQALAAMKNAKDRFRQFRHLARELSRLRRDDQRALRTILRRQIFESTLEDSGTGVPPVIPTLGPPASRRQDPMEPEPPKTPEPSASPAPNSSTLKPLNSQTPSKSSSESASISAICGENPEPETPDSELVTPPALNSLTPKLLGAPKPSEGGLNSQTPPPPVPPKPTKTHHKIFSIPQRGRRFTCIEG